MTGQRDDDRPLRKRGLAKGDAGGARVRKGEIRALSDGPESIASDPTFDRQIEAARSVMRRYRGALRKLAK